MKVIETPEHKPGVYLIKNISDGKVYVGSSVNIYKRAKVHKKTLQNGKHRNIHLQNAYNKYGADSFTFTVLEYCDLSTVRLRERVYIQSYNCTCSKYGYNISSLTEEGNIAHSEETKKKISHSSKRLWYNMTEEERRSLIERGGEATAKKKRKKVLCSNGMVFESLRAAAKHFKMQSSALCYLVNTENARSIKLNGLSFTYYTEESC